MLNTNLLPPEEKRIIELEEASRIVRFFALVLAASLVVGIVLLLPSFLPFILERAELRQTLKLGEGVLAGENTDKISQASRNIKNTIVSLEFFLRTTPRGFDTLQQFLGSSKTGIEITTLTAKKGGSIVINGSAQTRKDLLDFEDALRKKNQLQELLSPLSNIIREDNINFSMQGKLKPMYSL